VLCSTATGAGLTLANTGFDARVLYSDRLYGATPGTMIDEINEAPDTVNTLLVVGHEPTMSAVAIGLAGAASTDAAAVERISEKFPTSAIAVLTVASDWKNLELNRAALIGFHVAR
jgi:phosphohistidine phosphatase